MKKTNFPKALVFALCLTILYILFVVFIVEPSGYDGIAYYFYIPPFVFLGGIVLYYVFNFFKQIKKMIWFYVGLGLVILISLYNLGFAEIDIKLKNMFHFSQLPSEYKNYSNISNDTVYHFGNKVMRLKFTSDKPVQTYINPNNELIVITNKVQGNSHTDVYKSDVTTFKLDKNGNVIDQYQYEWNVHQYNNREILFEGYHINTSENYYHTWALDGDKTKRSIAVINENLEWDKPKQKEFYKTIASKLKFFTQFSSHSNESKKLIYLEDGKCGIFNFRFLPDDGEIESRGNSNNNVFRRYSTKEYKFVPIKAKNIQYRYFHKKKLVRIWSYIGGNTPATSSDQWQGELYTDVKIDTDTLKIKEQLLLDPKWKTTHIEIDRKRIGALSRNRMPITPYLYYAHPKLSFQLFTNEENRLFVIQNLQ